MAKRFLFLILGLVASAASALPPLKALDGFQAGQWQVKAIGATDGGREVCATGPEMMLTGGRSPAQCEFTSISDSDGEAVVTYHCPGGRTGRTAIRRDAAGIYTVHAQGVDGGRPFAGRSEWRRAGGC